MKIPLIFDIKRHSLEDGSGIRTTVFFKGCNLNCAWCHNPESISPDAEIGFYPSHCIACRACEKICAHAACSIGNPSRIDRIKCSRCGECVKVCPSLGLRMIGRFYSTNELISILLRDKVYYEVSGGGVTFSGGEPTLYMDYLSSILHRLKKMGINTAIQTNGYFSWTKFKSKLLDAVDIVMFDIKLAGSKDHLRYTGRSNRIILKNFEHLLKQAKIQVIPRIPLIPQITDTKTNMEKLSSILKKFEVHGVMLPYNTMGTSKWKVIGKKSCFNLM